MRRFGVTALVTIYLLAPLGAGLRPRPAAAQAAAAGAPDPAAPIAEAVLARLGLGIGAGSVGKVPAPRPGGLAGPRAAGQPNVLNANGALSAAVITTIGGRGTQFSEVGLLADWDGREDGVADRAALIDDFSFVEIDIDFTLTRAAISAHTRANGQPTSNFYYYGDSVGNLWIGQDADANGLSPRVDALQQVNIPTLVNTLTSGGFLLLNPQPGDAISDQVAVTGIAVNPVADLGDFGFCDTVGEVVYVSVLDTSGGSANASNQPFRTRIFAFGLMDNAGVLQPVGAYQLLRNALGNLAGVAVDDDGSLYFQLVDLAQLTGAAIFKATEGPRVVAGCVGGPRINRTITSIPAGLTGGINLTLAFTLVAGGVRLTNYSGTATTFGNIAAIAAGPGDTLYAAVARSFVATDDPATQATEGLFANPAALGDTPSMILSFADVAGATGPTGAPVGDGFADAAASGLTRTAGVNNFRVFALGAGPDRRGAPGTASPVFGTTADTLQLDFQVDHTIYSGLAVDEARRVYVVSGGTPAGAGVDPSPRLGEILSFADRAPADRRADFVDLRGDQVPNPPASGVNVGDGDSDRFDHIFWQAPRDPVTLMPTGIAGLGRGFLRYTNRLATVEISPGVTLGTTDGTLADDGTAGPIFFDLLDPGHQVAGGDDQNTPFQGDDSDGGGFPPLAGVLNGGFEFTFGGIVAGTCTTPWNAFFLNANGNITFGAGSADFSPSGADLLTGPPRIAGAWADINPRSRTGGFLTTFPVQALGFAGVNHFKIRWINVPSFGQEALGAQNTFSISLFDDGTGPDENTSQVVDPSDPTGDNVDPAFDIQEGPTDERFVSTPGGALGPRPPRSQGSGPFTFEYDRMDARGDFPRVVIVGYSIGGQAAGSVAETNLSEAGRDAVVGAGTEAAFFEVFDAGDFDLRSEGNDAADTTPAGQGDRNREVLDFFGQACQPVPLTLAVDFTGGGGGTVTGQNLACPGDCGEPYGSGSTVTVTAAPDAASTFDGWLGCDSVAGFDCIVTLRDFRFVTARFIVTPAPPPPPPPPPPGPLTLSLNQAAFATGQTLILSASLTPGVLTPVDAYVVVDVPGLGTLSLLLNGGVAAGTVPVGTNFIPFAFSGPIFQYTFTGTEPAGAYQFRAFLTTPGTLDVVGIADLDPFTVGP
jgi:hypothetical protein